MSSPTRSAANSSDRIDASFRDAQRRRDVFEEETARVLVVLSMLSIGSEMKSTDECHNKYHVNTYKISTIRVHMSYIDHSKIVHTKYYNLITLLKLMSVSDRWHARRLHAVFDDR